MRISSRKKRAQGLGLRPRTISRRHRAGQVSRWLHPEPLERRYLLAAAGIAPLGEDGGFSTAAANLTVQFRLEATDLSGTPIPSIEMGSPFILRAYVQDVRAETETPGIFSGYLDILFDELLGQPTGPVTFAPEFTNVQSGDLSTPGLIDDAGASTGGATNTQDEYFLFSVPFEALMGGTLTFVGQPATSVREVTVFGSNEAVPAEQIDYGQVSLDIIAPPAISVATTSVQEGDEGFAELTFAVSLSPAHDSETVTVNYATLAGTASAGADYIDTSGTLTFGPGETEQTVTVQVVGDRIFEPNETLSLLLSSPTNATLEVDQAEGTILNDDPQPTISVAGVSVAEGNSGTTATSVTVTLSNPSSETITVLYATSADTATAGADYQSASGTVTFNPGVTQQTIPLQIVGDNVHEANETFNLELSSPANAMLGQATAVVEILDDDGPPAVSISTASIVEGDGGTNDIVFNVSLSHPSDFTITVDYSTLALTAAAGVDFESRSGTLTFTPGETQQTIAVPVIGDTLSEANETFRVDLSAPSNATIGNGQAEGTIQDDDPVPSLSVAAANVTEGNASTTTLQFTVQLSAISGQTVSVDYATAPGTASAGVDYNSASGTLTFEPGETAKTISVTVLGDLQFETDETLLLNLSSPIGATIQTAQAVGTILDDDQRPTISIADVSAAEGNAGTTAMQFTVSLSNPSSDVITVEYQTVSGTAAAGIDYQDTTGILTFEAGQTEQTVDVLIVGDTLFEPDETFTLELFSPENAELADGEAVGTITNDDQQPTIVISDAEVLEGDDGTTELVFTVQLSTASALPVEVNFATAAGTATETDDFQSQSGTLTFLPEQTIQTITILVVGDTVPEADETLFVELSDPTGATLQNEQATGTILDDDEPPTLSISDVSISEGNSGTRAMQFTVTLSRTSSQTVNVSFATQAGTSTSDVDFESNGGVLSFAPGVLQQTVTIQIIGDELDEADETLAVVLSSPENATLADNIGLGTILDDDPQPTISIANASAVEGNSGTTLLEFVVTLSAPSGRPVTVAFTTADDSATVGDGDYLPVSGTVTFEPGETQKSVFVSANGDTRFESTETFFVNLSNPTNATFQRSQGQGEIQNDDAPFTPGSVSGFVYVDVNNNGQRDARERPLAGVTVRMTGTDDFGAAINAMVLTGEDGSYRFDNLSPGNYVITQTQPAFFLDGIDTLGPAGGVVDSNLDRFTIRIDSGTGATDNNFGERGLRPEFISKRLFLASLPTDGYYTALNLGGGPLWFSLDAGWNGVLTAEVLNGTSNSPVVVTLYDRNLQELVGSGVGNGQARIDWLGNSGDAYFLKISGFNSVVDLRLSAPQSNLGQASFSALSAAGPTGWEPAEEPLPTASDPSPGRSAVASATATAPSRFETNAPVGVAATRTATSLHSDTIDRLFAELYPARSFAGASSFKADEGPQGSSDETELQGFARDFAWRAWSADRKAREAGSANELENAIDRAWESFHPRASQATRG